MQDSEVNDTYFYYTYSETNDAVFSDLVLFLRSITEASTVVQIIECVLMNVLNVALIYSLVTSSPLRRPLRNGMLGALTLANLVTGLHVLPLHIDGSLSSHRRHPCPLKWTSAMFLLYVENFVQLWTLVLLLLHHLAQLLGWKVPPEWWNSESVSHFLSRALRCLYVLLPWLVALTVVVPVLVSVHGFTTSWDNCFHSVLPHHYLALKVMTCFLPATLIVVLGAVLAAVRLTCGKERRRPTFSLSSQPSPSPEAVSTSRLRLTPDDDDDDDDVLDPDPTYVHVLVGLTTVVLLLPVHAWSLHRPAHVYDFKHYITVDMCFSWANDLAPPVQALLWLLLLPDLRTRLQQIWATLVRRLLCKRESSSLSASGAAVPTVRFATLTGND